MTMSKVRQADLACQSGNVTSADPLVDFLYDLMRDHLPIGKVEALMGEVNKARGLVSKYTNGYLANYARGLAFQLSSTSEFEREIRRIVSVKQKAHEKCFSEDAVDRQFILAITQYVQETK